MIEYRKNNFLSKRIALTYTCFLLLFLSTLSLSAADYGIYAHRECLDPINNLQIFGERYSGTNYLQSLLWENLDKSVIKDDPLEWYNYGWKHFPLWLNVPFERNPKGSSMKDYNFEGSDSYLFVIIFRDPYDWVRSIHKRPHHAQNLLHNRPFHEFIQLPWLCEVEIDLNPHTGLYFDNVLKLRSARINNMLLIKERVKNIYYVKYETIRDYPQEVLKEISEIFNIPLNPNFTPIIAYKGDKDGGAFTKSTYFDLSQTELEFINSQLEEAEENRIGYKLLDNAEDVNTR